MNKEYSKYLEWKEKQPQKPEDFSEEAFETALEIQEILENRQEILRMLQEYGQPIPSDTYSDDWDVEDYDFEEDFEEDEGLSGELSW